MLTAATALKPWITGDRVRLLAAFFALAALGLAEAAGRWGLAVYGLSFWHYPIYALAFFRRRISLARFKRDAVLAKTVSLAALGAVLAATGPSLLSLTVMAGGFALTIAAARALGPDRTYYGVEVAGLPPARTTAFPFSLLPHPMLVGNMTAFGAPLLDGAFREAWWPLALLHVLLNGLLLPMEVCGRESRLLGTVWPLAGLGLGAVLLIIGFWDVWPFALATAVMGLAFGAALMGRYARAAGHETLQETPS